MKKVVIAVLCVGISTQANASIGAYVRAAATGALTNSDFNVEGSVSVDGTKDNTRDLSVIRHKNHAIRNIGVRVSAGIQTKLDYNWFFGGELNWFMDRTKHDHDFIDAVDNLNLGFDDDERISYVNIKAKDEFGFAFRFGKDLISHDIYGICGITSKRIEFKYGLDNTYPNTPATEDLVTDCKKRMWGLVFGLGVSRKINRNLSCSLEYRYKIYNTSSETVNWIKETADFFGRDPNDPSKNIYDTTPRKFKIKSDNHELSIGFTLNV